MSGVVEDENGAPVADCLITPHSLSFDGRELGVRSNNSGEFNWPGITPGNYTFEATCIDAEGNAVATGESETYSIGENSRVRITVN